MNSSKSLLFHGGDTGSIPVRDAKAINSLIGIPIFLPLQKASRDFFLLARSSAWRITAALLHHLRVDLPMNDSPTSGFASDRIVLQTGITGASLGSSKGPSHRFIDFDPYNEHLSARRLLYGHRIKRRINSYSVVFIWEPQ